MKEKTAEKKPAAYTGKATYNEAALTAFCKVQFSAFRRQTQVFVALLGLALVVLAVCGVTSGGVSVILGALGCWIITLPGVLPKSDADRLIAAMQGNFSTSVYSFDDKGFDIVAGKDTNRLGYDNMIRLIEDDMYYFFFATPKLAYIVEKASVRPFGEEKFKSYVSRRVGLEWTKSRPWYRVSLRSLIDEKKNTRKIPKQK